MFTLETVQDVIRIPPHLLATPTLQGKIAERTVLPLSPYCLFVLHFGKAIHREIDTKYPNRILMDTGLVIARYGDCLRVDHGVCIPGEGGAHHECSFCLIVFRPFVEEVVLGKVLKSTPEGVQVSLGFFSDIFIPAYWMLNPSRYEEKSGLWVWTPQYDDEEEERGDTNGDGESENHYEMYLGAEIRFKVKSINFAQITNTAKGKMATMTTTSHMPLSSSSGKPPDLSSDTSRPVRQRSSSVGIDESEDLPASMHIVGSICEDGLGLTEWWKNDGGEEEGDGF